MRATTASDGIGGPGGGGPGGGGPGGGAQWGDGTAAINYLGTDTSTYQKYYTLKSSDAVNPWQDLVNATNILDQTEVADLDKILPTYFDLDKILWHLAGEVLFSDDDSYIYKGKMDYYLYIDAETGRLCTYDYDGNSVMKSNHTTWSPYYNANNVNYPLMNKLLANPDLKQRYLAHLRVLIKDYFNESSANALIDKYGTLIDLVVKNDPKKKTSYAQFGSENNCIKEFYCQ